MVSGVKDKPNNTKSYSKLLRSKLLHIEILIYSVKKGCFVEEHVVNSVNRDPKNAFEMLEIVGAE